MKKNRSNLLIMNFLFSFGSAMVGVFFPFLVSKAFGFEIWQLMIWFIGIHLVGVLIVYPLNKFLNNFFSIKQNLQIGLLFFAVFYLILSFSRDSVFLILLATCFFLLGIYVFWPSYHLLNLQSTKTGKRGNHIGNLQAAFVSANILAPLISGFLLQNNLDSWVSLVATVSFGSAIYFSWKLEFLKYKLENFAGIWKFFSKNFYKSPALKLTIIDGIQSGTLWAIWPVFLKSVLVGFSQMGIFVSLMAGVEIVSAKFSGVIVDKNSAKKSLKFASIVRFFDFGIRGLLFWFPTVWMAGIVSFFAGFLGPIFNISFYTRLIEIAEKNPEKEFEFFIIREWVLGIIRIFIFILAAWLSFYFDVKYLVTLIFIAAFVSFGLRKT